MRLEAAEGVVMIGRILGALAMAVVIVTLLPFVLILAFLPEVEACWRRLRAS